MTRGACIITEPLNARLLTVGAVVVVRVGNVAREGT